MLAYVEWLIYIGIILILLELIVPGAILSFLGAALVVVALLIKYQYITDIYTAMMTFFVLSLFFILVLRSIFLRVMPGDTEVHDTNEDNDVMGSVVEVVEHICPDTIGRVRFRDSTWRAKSNQKLPVGSQAEIIGRDADTWIIQQASEE